MKNPHIENSNNDNHNKRKAGLWFKKHKLLGICLVSLPVVSAATVGTLYLTGVFEPTVTKIDIKTGIFANDTAHWKTSTPAPADGGYVWNTVASPLTTIPDVQDVITDLNLYASTTSYGYVINELVIDNIGSVNNSWNSADVGVKASSRTFEGTFKFYYYLQTTGHGNLIADLANKSIDLSSPSTGSVNVTSDDFLQALKTANSDLDTNAISIVWTTDTTTVYTGGFGPNSADSLTNSWNISSDLYSNISITPKVGFSYYAGQSPVDGITLKLKRPELSAATNWKLNWSTSNSFYVTPVATQIESRIVDNYSDTSTFTWFTNLTGTYGNTWSCTIDGGIGIFLISGNPYWNSQVATTAATVADGYKLPYQLNTKINVSSQMIDSGSAPIETLAFKETPRQIDVIDALKLVIKSDVQPNIAWNQITITINSAGKTIVLSGMSSSLIYTTVTYTINYTTAW